MVDNIQDAEALQSNLNELCLWAFDWQMAFNEDKYTTLTVSCSHQVISYPYKINGLLLEQVQHHKFLGVELSRDPLLALSARLTILLDLSEGTYIVALKILRKTPIIQ